MFCTSKRLGFILQKTAVYERILSRMVFWKLYAWNSKGQEVRRTRGYIETLLVMHVIPLER